jgi:hypothetical protein
MAGYFGLVGHDFHGNRKGSLTCRKYDTGPTALLPFQRKACSGFFTPGKKSDGFGRVFFFFFFFFFCTIVDRFDLLFDLLVVRVTNFGQIILLPLPKEGML